MVCNKIIKIVFINFVGFFAFSNFALSLPFNDDMVHSKNAEGRHMYYSTGQIMRAKPEGSVAVGSLEYSVKDKDEAETLENPYKNDPKSWKYGKRLFKINCSPCHGNIEAKGYEPGPVSTKFAAPPDISAEPYITGRSDGYIYGVIHFGGMAVMPGLGWKMSPKEHWDIINYVRHVQKSKTK
jgi:mono/diheme cytochrome c family protein